MRTPNLTEYGKPPTLGKPQVTKTQHHIPSTINHTQKSLMCLNSTLHPGHKPPLSGTIL